MSRIVWDQVGERTYETGVDHGVLYPMDATGAYPLGVAWNGLTAVTESPSGAESNKQYADNIEYLNLISSETFAATVEAFTYPKEFEPCNGEAEVADGVTIGQQNRQAFGLCYRTLKGDDVKATDAGYKIHLVYQALAGVSEKAYATVNDTPEAITFSWELSTTPVPVPGKKPSATLVIDSTKIEATILEKIEEILYGKDASGSDPAVPARMPLPAEIIEIIAAG